MTTYIIYHHDDPDGHAAAAVAAKAIRYYGGEFMIQFFAKQYTDDFLDHKDIKCAEVDDIQLIFTDLSFTKKTVQKLYDSVRCNPDVTAVTWIDHHASSEGMQEEVFETLRHDVRIHAIFNKELCGAVLTYLYYEMDKNEENESFFEMNFCFCVVEDDQYYGDLDSHIVIGADDDEEYDIPEFLYHLDNYDRWTKRDQYADAFITGLKLEGYQVGTILSSDKSRSDFNDKVYMDLEDTDMVDRFISDGITALKYQKQIYLEQSDLIGFMHLGPYKVAYKFAPGNSWNFNDLLDKNEVDIGMLIRYDPKSKLWVHSFYGNAKQTVKCNELAEVLGGGGHPGAAGCQIEWPIPTNFSDVCHKYTDLYTYIGKAINENPIQYSQACLDELAKNDKLNKIFLGGTCNLPDNYEWDFRKIIASHLSPDKYFNPVVEDWNEQAQKLEDEMKAKCLYHLYVIYPTSHNTYSLIEIGEALVTMENRVAVIVVKSMEDDDGNAYTFGEQQMHAFEKLANDNPHNVCICGSVEMMSFTLGKVIADFLSMMDASKTFVDILNNTIKNK